jgi:2-polyprenyl-3-methyl-5-hydroxy-6-metoxy-1,4-benzoquinol methylase
MGESIAMSSLPAGVARTEAKPQCPVCASGGDVLYTGLSDELYGVPGAWTLRKCRFRECGTVWLDPAPVAADLPKLYTRYHTHADLPPPRSALHDFYRRVVDAYVGMRFGYAPANLLWRSLALLLYLAPGRRAAADASVMSLAFRPGGRVLEVGCGRGAVLDRLKRFGWQAEGIDFDPIAVQTARNKGLDVRHGELEQMHYADGSFDAVVMSHVVEHVPDPRALLRETHRVLKEGGELVMYTPNSLSLGHRLYGPNWRGLEVPRHLNIFTPRSLARIAGEAGFRKVVSASIPRAKDALYENWVLRLYGSSSSHRRLGLWRRVICELADYAERAAIAIGREWGEEVLLRAVK